MLGISLRQEIYKSLFVTVYCSTLFHIQVCLKTDCHCQDQFQLASPVGIKLVQKYSHPFFANMRKLYPGKVPENSSMKMSLGYSNLFQLEEIGKDIWSQTEMVVVDDIDFDNRTSNGVFKYYIGRFCFSSCLKKFLLHINTIIIKFFFTPYFWPNICRRIRQHQVPKRLKNKSRSGGSPMVF